jgi:hypothetical protein
LHRCRPAAARAIGSRPRNSPPWGEKLRKQIARWARPAILETVIGSAGMNAFAFAANTTTAWMTSATLTLGIAIPTRSSMR